MASKRKASSKRERPGDYVGFRSPADLKQRLANAAENAGRSLSSEAQFRLERSFEREDLLNDTLDLAFGKPIAGVLMLLGTAMKQAALRQSYKTGAGNALPGDEILETEPRTQAFLAARLIIENFAPPKPLGTKGSMGEVVAAGWLDWLEKPAASSNRQLSEIRERLIPIHQGGK